MTEEELFKHICSMADASPVGRQPPFAEVAMPLHPDQPVDFEEARENAFDVLGSSDFLYHPPAGAPHIDVHRYPPHGDRDFWCYITNGMSDFPQNLPDGNTFRSELTCCTKNENPIWAEFLREMATFPFRARTFLHCYHTVPWPGGVGSPRFTYIMTIPPFTTPELSRISFLGQELLVMSLIRITDEERQKAVEEGSRVLVDSLPDILDTWLIDGRSD